MTWRNILGRFLVALILAYAGLGVSTYAFAESAVDFTAVSAAPTNAYDSAAAPSSASSTSSASSMSSCLGGGETRTMRTWKTQGTWRTASAASLDYDNFVIAAEIAGKTRSTDATIERECEREWTAAYAYDAAGCGTLSPDNSFPIFNF